MEDLLLRVARVSLATSLLIGALLLLAPLLRRRYPARWCCLAWMLLALRLLVPASFTLPQAPVRIEVPQRAAAVVDRIEPQAEEGAAASAPQSNAPVNSASPVADKTDQEPELPVEITLSAVAGAVWLTGCVLFLLVQLGSYGLFLHRLRKGNTCPAPPSVKEALWQIGVEMGVCRLPEPLVTDQVEAPMLTGILRLRLLLPHVRYEEEELDFILRHELIHYRRGDMWCKLVLLAANALHWFNPLVYLMTDRAGKDIELSCDDAVVRELDREGRERYGSAILATLPRRRRMEPMLSTHFGSTKKNIKSRLRNLFDLRAKRRGAGALCTVVACAFLLTAAVTIGSAASPQTVEASQTPISQTQAAPVIAEQSPDGRLDIALDSLGAGQVARVGKIELTPGIAYTGAIRAESGDGIFVGLHRSPDIQEGLSTGWDQSYGSGDGRTIGEFRFDSEETVTYYLYVGCKGGGLGGITGSVVRHGAGVAAGSSRSAGDEPIPYLLVHARGDDWAAAATIETAAYGEQLAQEAAWIEQTHREKGAPFVISETVPLEHATDLVHIQNLYNRSEIYRSMNRMRDGVFQVEDGQSTARFGSTDGRVQRAAVMVEQDIPLTLEYDYRLDQGSMAVWLLDPAGNLAHQGAMAQSGRGSVPVSGQPGLWSVITSYEGDRQSGTIEIALRAVQDELSQQLAYSVGEPSDFTVRRLGIHTLAEGDELAADVQWTGDGFFTLLHTPELYTDEELEALLTGGTGSSREFDFSGYRGRMFLFTQSAQSPLQRREAADRAGTYHFYLISQGDIQTLGGQVSLGRAGGRELLWEQQESASSSGLGKSAAVDAAAAQVMEYSRSWYMVEQMLPFMTEKGIDSVVAQNNRLNPQAPKRAGDYYQLAAPSQAESDQRSYQMMSDTGNWTYSSPLFPYMSNSGIDKVVSLYNQRTGRNVRAVDYYN